MSPPPRPAYLFQTENGETREVAQWSLLLRLKVFCGLAFRGDADGTMSEAEEVSPNCFRAEIASSLGAGMLELSLAPDGWVKAEVSAGGAVVFRAWIEYPYEEKEGLPDGSDGIGEGPLRISKRGSWLSIDARSFPGVPKGENGYFQLEDKAH